MLRMYSFYLFGIFFSFSLFLFRSVQTDEQLDDSSQKNVARLKKPFTLYEKRKRKNSYETK